MTKHQSQSIYRSKWNFLVAALTVLLAYAPHASGEFSIGKEIFRNPDFVSSTDQWNLFSNAQAVATYNTASVSLPGNYVATINILTQAETSDSVRLKHTLPIGEGSIYTLTFWARADRPRVIAVKLKRGQSPWNTMGLNKDVFLTPSWQRFEYTFTGGATDAAAALIFTNMGRYAGSQFDFAGVSVKSGVKELLGNGDFSMGDMAWKFITPGSVWADWAITQLTTNNAMVVEVLTPGNESWQVRVVQKNLALRGNTRYRLQFWGKADRNHQAAVRLKNSTTSALFGGQVQLTGQWQRFEAVFFVEQDTNADFLLTNLGDEIAEYEFSGFSLREVGRYDPRSGIYAVWYNSPDVLDLDFVRGGQAVEYWSAVEPSKGNYDFSRIDQDVAQVTGRGKYVTVEVSGDGHPSYLFDNVPFHVGVIAGSVDQKVDGGRSLQYWHPYYKAAYANVLDALSTHVAAADYRDKVLGIRLNLNALGTEADWVPTGDRSSDSAKWVIPHPGIKWAGDWTPKVLNDYSKFVFNAYNDAFSKKGVWVFARNTLTFPDLPFNMFSEGKLGLFHTSSEIEPRNQTVENGYKTFLTYSRTGQTTALAEAWHDMWYNHKNPHPRVVSPVQWNYWTLLGDLNAGVSFMAVRGKELEAINPGSGYDAVFRSEVNEAFSFASRYAGHHADPIASPGAWVALRDGVYLVGDYNFLMTRLDGDVNTSLPPDLEEEQDNLSYGPSAERFGAWARRIPTAGRMRFKLDDMFARSLDNKKAKVRLVYLDDGRGTFSVEFCGLKNTVKLTGTGDWKEIEYPIGKAFFAADEDGADVSVKTASDTALTLHMIEVKRDGPGN